MDKKKDITIHIGLTDKEHKTIEREAKKEKRKVSPMARILIEEAIAARKIKTNNP